MSPCIGLTLGDPAGVGAEVALKAVLAPGVERLTPLLIGDLALARETAARLGLRCRIEPVEEAALLGGRRPRRRREGRTAVVPLLCVGALPPRARRPGKPSLAGGRAAYGYVETAVRLARAGAIDAIVTAPISKEWVTRAGRPISGHTELLRDLTGAAEARMMFVGGDLRVILVTVHIALEAVPAALRSADVARTIVVAAEHLRRYHRLRRPRLAVAGLNPHAGEAGLFGEEERKLIAPAIARVRRTGVDVTGPYPADTLFVRAVAGEFDAVIAMYHDQGLIPLKLLHFHDAVNVTLGLPIVRTSPDHGTAYDIAGRGVAHPGSMLAALRLAARMTAAPRRGARPVHRPGAVRAEGGRGR